MAIDPDADEAAGRCGAGSPIRLWNSGRDPVLRRPLGLGPGAWPLKLLRDELRGRPPEPRRAAASPRHA